MAAVASAGRGDEPQNGTRCPSAVPSPVWVQGWHSPVPLPTKLMPVPHTQRQGGCGGHLHPPLKPRGRLGSREQAMCHPVPVPPTACARAQQHRECLAFPVPAGCLPAGAAEEEERGWQGHCHAPLTLPAAPHMALAMGLASPTAQDPKPLTPGAPPNPRIPGSGLGAGSWERAMFSPSAPDDAGGFFGSGSLLRQREQNQSGCLVGLETNKTPWQALRAGWSGQRGAGTGSPRPEIHGHGVLLSGSGKRAGLAPWLRLAPFPSTLKGL